MNALFSEVNAPVPLGAQIECVLREIEMRKVVYARRVEDHKMTQRKADDELAAMRAVLTTLRRHQRYEHAFANIETIIDGKIDTVDGASACDRPTANDYGQIQNQIDEARRGP